MSELIRSIRESKAMLNIDQLRASVADPNQKTRKISAEAIEASYRATLRHKKGNHVNKPEFGCALCIARSQL